MAPKRVLHLGAGPLMAHSIRRLKENGFEVYAADRNPRAPSFAIADGHSAVDICDVDAVTKYARAIGASVMLAVNEWGVMCAAEASARLGLRNLPPEVAERCLSKAMMRDCWRKAGLPQPDYRIVRNRREMFGAADEVGYPLILKPSRNTGSRGVSLVSCRSDLPWSVEFAEQNSQDGTWIVEEYVSGTEMTIEGLVQNAEPHILAMSDKEPQEHSRYRVAMALNYPAAFAPPQIRLAEEIVGKAALALGIQNGAFHCECMVNARGVFLVEMAGRAGGGHIFGQIVEAVSGVCMPAALARIFLGESVALCPAFRRGACYKFFAPPPGIFDEVHGVEDAGKMPGILDLGFTMKPGTLVEAIDGDANRPGFVVSEGASRQEAIDHADRAIAAIGYTVRPAEAGATRP